jgi:hypothetical protein
MLSQEILYNAEDKAVEKDIKGGYGLNNISRAKKSRR